MSYISEIFARQILDSRGNPTVEVDVLTDEGLWAVQQYQAVPVQGYMKQLNYVMVIRKMYGGKGVLKAVKNVNTIIAPELLGWDVADQTGIDAMMIAVGWNSK